MRELREPDAVPIVQNGRLRMGVRRFTQSHDKVQIMDNAKHVLFSTKTFEVPADGALKLGVTIDSTGTDCVEGDLYDGFASLLCLDFSTGTAIDIFCRDDLCAAVFARLPFPGVEVPDIAPMKYWGIFDERRLSAAGPHDYAISIDSAAGAITWTVDGELVREQTMPDYELGPLMLGLGLMTEKDIGPDGSVSVHGQGVGAEWSPITITTVNPHSV
jgi:hypothetical protein